MATVSVADRLFDLLAPLAEQRDLELVATEVVGAKSSPIVRVYLDTDGGIDLDAIAQANAWISDALEAEPPVDGAYSLEVSSPGIERPLRKIEDFDRFAGERATIKTHGPIDGRRSFTGVITGVSGTDVELDCDGESVLIPLGDIAKANLKPELDFGTE